MSRGALAIVVLAGCAQASNPIDAAPIDAVPVDAAVDAAASDAGATLDTCAGAVDLTAMASGADGVTVNGDLTGFANDVQPPMACTGFSNDGPDAIYLVTIGNGQTVTATLTPQGWDGALTLVQPCVMTPLCLAGSDSTNPEVASYTATSPTAVYIVVDSYDPTVFGRYTLNVRVQ